MGSLCRVCSVPEDEEVSVGGKEVGFLNISIMLNEVNEQMVKVFLYLKANEKGEIPKELVNPSETLMGSHLTPFWGFLRADRQYRFMESCFKDGKGYRAYEKASEYMRSVKEKIKRVYRNVGFRKYDMKERNNSIVKINIE